MYRSGFLICHARQLNRLKSVIKNIRKLVDAVEKIIRENATQYQAMENFMRTFTII